MDVIDFSRIDGLYSPYQRRVSEVIKDVFPTVRLIRLEMGHPNFNPDRPFALIDEPLGVPSYVIRTLHESEIDHRLLAELLRNNMNDPNSEISKLRLLEMAEAAMDAKREQEWREERKDVLKSAMKSHKNTWSHNGKTIRK